MKNQREQGYGLLVILINAKLEAIATLELDKIRTLGDFD